MKIHSTTILSVRHRGKVAIGGDGQVTLGSGVMKSNARKIRSLLDGQVLCGFAGVAADCMELMGRLESNLKDYPTNLPKAAIETVKAWRTDRSTRGMTATLCVVSASATLLIDSAGAVIEPADGLVGIGSGGNFALSAAKALLGHSDLSAPEIVRHGLEIAADICIYTNSDIVVEELECSSS